MQDFSIAIDEIEAKTPFQPGAGRQIPQAVFYNPDYTAEELPGYVEDQDWHLFVPNPDGGLTLLRDPQPVKAVYFGVESAKEGDIQIPFFTFYYQHASFPNIVEYFDSILEDIRHLSACISKLGIYQYLSEESDIDVTQYVLTEFETIFTICRSLFDTVHKVSVESWSNIQLFDGGKNDLPASLTDMVLDGYDPVSADDLTDRYGIQTPLAEYYEELAEFISDLKYQRDSVHHYGGSFDVIFSVDKGIAVDSSREPYTYFDAWEESQIQENDLAPIWPFVAHVIGNTVQFMNNLPGAVFANIKVPPEIAPEYGVYLRGPHIDNLLRVNSLGSDDIWGESIVEVIKSDM